MASSLNSRAILVVEDEPLIGFDLADALEAAGAQAHYARRMSYALKLIDNHTFHGAVIDWDVPDETAETLCKSLEERGVPYVVYSGLTQKPNGCDRGLFIPKPTTTEHLIGAVTQIVTTAA